MRVRLLNPTPVEGGNGATTTTTETKPATPPVDASEGFKAALKRVDGDAMALARDAYSKADQLREENATLKGKLPKDGTVVLEGDDLAAWNSFKGLGKFEDVQKKLDEHAELAVTTQKHEREKLVTKAGKLHGFDPEVLALLVGSETNIEFKPGKDKLGKDIEIAEVVTTETDERGDKQVRTRLDAYMAKHFAKMLPSLKGVPAPQQQPGNQSVLPRAAASRERNDFSGTSDAPQRKPFARV